MRTRGVGGLRTRLGGMSRRGRIVVAAVAVAAVGFGGYKAYGVAVAEYHLRAAEAAAARDDQPAARRHLTACLTARPDSPGVNFLAARAARRDGDFAAAARYLKLTEQLGWDPAAIDIERTLLRGQTGEFRRVEGRIADWARLGTADQPLFFEVLVPNYLLRHDLNSAYAVLAEWTGREPNAVRARLWQADVCEKLQRPAEAKEAARVAAAAAPDRADVRLRYGQLLADSHEPADAIPHLTRALELAPGDPAAALALATCLHEQGDATAAAKVVDDLLTRKPDDPPALGLRGKIALLANDPGAAAGFLGRSLDRAPTDPAVLNDMALALTQLGRADEARRFRDRHAAAAKDLDELQQTTRAVANDPRNPDLRYQAGVLLARNGFPEAGARWLESALAENPAHPPSRQALADIRAGKVVGPGPGK